MMRAVVASQSDNKAYSFKLEPSTTMSMQMFKLAMGEIWPGNYQVSELQIDSPDPQVTEKYSEMTDARKAMALHDQWTRVVTFSGRLFIAKENYPLSFVCTMHDCKMMWEPATVVVEIGTDRKNFRFQPVSVDRSIGGLGDVYYRIEKDSRDEGPQPAKI